MFKCVPRSAESAADSRFTCVCFCDWCWGSAVAAQQVTVHDVQICVCPGPSPTIMSHRIAWFQQGGFLVSGPPPALFVGAIALAWAPWPCPSRSTSAGVCERSSGRSQFASERDWLPQAAWKLPRLQCTCVRGRSPCPRPSSGRITILGSCRPRNPIGLRIL